MLLRRHEAGAVEEGCGIDVGSLRLISRLDQLLDVIRQRRVRLVEFLRLDPLELLRLCLRGAMLRRRLLSLSKALGRADLGALVPLSVRQLRPPLILRHEVLPIGPRACNAGRNIIATPINASRLVNACAIST